MKESLWTNDIDLPEFEKLRGDKTTDVLIIGGGLCGILCAYFLNRAGVDYILVEGKRIAGGITQNTTAKITSQHRLIYAKLLKDLGREKAWMYLSAQEEALATYEKLCRTIDCGFEKKNAYTYALNQQGRKNLEDELQAVNTLGMEAKFVENPDLPFRTQGAVMVPDQAQFHPLKFVAKIVKELRIYENTFIREITPNTATTEEGSITANSIIITTHFPFINKHGGYFIKLYQQRSYVCAYENVPNLDGMYVDENEKGLSFRSYDNLLLLGGGSHRTGKNSEGWAGLHRFAEIYYPQARLKYEWAAQDCMSLDSIPYIGKYAKSTPNLYVASGFCKWGMTSSMAAAQILTGMVTGRESPYAEVFSPQRSFLKPQLFINGWESAAHLLNPGSKRCPHLGCALKWNTAEHTWDCPCHGSRFEEDGTLLDNPATGNAKWRGRTMRE